MQVCALSEVKSNRRFISWQQAGLARLVCRST